MFCVADDSSLAKAQQFILLYYYAGGPVYDISEQGASVIYREHPVQLHRTENDVHTVHAPFYHVPRWEHDCVVYQGNFVVWPSW